MKSGSRYAIYFVPAADQPLFRFGSAVLGYDCYSGEELAYPASHEGACVKLLHFDETPISAHRRD
jgi:hypothetical protein